MHSTPGGKQKQSLTHQINALGPGDAHTAQQSVGVTSCTYLCMKLAFLLACMKEKDVAHLQGRTCLFHVNGSQEGSAAASPAVFVAEQPDKATLGWPNPGTRTCSQAEAELCANFPFLGKQKALS